MKHLGPPPYVCLITEGKADPANYEFEKLRIVGTVVAAAADGVGLVQIREKRLPARSLFDLTRAVVDALSELDALVVVNDRADIAVAAGANGVHLPEASLSPDIVRRAFGSDLMIGVSTHTVDAAKTAAGGGADYIFFGPVFESPGKGPAVGLGQLGEVCRELTGFATIALGGLDDKNFEFALDAGAAGIAGIRSLNDATTRRSIFGRLAATRTGLS